MFITFIYFIYDLKIRHIFFYLTFITIKFKQKRQQPCKYNHLFSLLFISQ